MAAYKGERGFGYRWPWLSAEDYELLNGLTAEQATSFLRLIREQAAGDRAFREAVASASAPELAHRWTYGAGGGRHVPTVKGAE